MFVPGLPADNSVLGRDEEKVVTSEGPETVEGGDDRKLQKIAISHSVNIFDICGSLKESDLGCHS